MISFIYSSFKIILYFQEIVCTSMAMCYSNNKQIYPYAYCASLVCFTVELLHLSMIQNCFDHIKPGICFKNTHTHTQNKNRTSFFIFITTYTRSSFYVPSIYESTLLITYLRYLLSLPKSTKN